MVTRRIPAILLMIALALTGALVGGLVSGRYASAVPHPCQESECNRFLIFWESCDANPGRQTYCGNHPDGGCYTDACGHS